MNGCPFKVGEKVKTSGKWPALVVYIGDLSSKWPVLAIHDDLSQDGSVRCAWHSLRGEPMEAHTANLIPPTPPMKRVPLEPADVPPGSVVSSNLLVHGEDWELVNALDVNGFETGRRGRSWVGAMEAGYLIKRPGEDWQPMWKEVPEEGGQP